MSNPDATPAWLREIDRLSLSRTQIFLHGNVKDSFFYPVGDALEIGPLRDAVFSHFTGKGYAIVASYNLVDGMTFADPSMAALFDQAVGDAEKAQPKVSGKAPGPRRTEEPVVQALQQMRLCLANRKHACMFMVEQAPQLFASAGSLAMEERLAMLRVLRTSVESVRVASRQNTLIMICDGLTEMPPWLVMNNPFVGSVEIDRPRRLERQRFFRSFFRTANEDPRLDELAELTEGMSTRELIGLRALSGQSDAPKEPKRLVDRFKFGQRESQWDSLKPEDLKDLEGTLSRRVIGQTAAVATVADVLRRARLHLSGAGGSSRNKPRGVLFFAGATGVGKTELAKAIAELVFGDDEMCVRFDMSEYNQAHSDQRLLGAPPGYVGYEEGGQLTNRVRANPFCVLLFDEIEKAHPNILDKFLGILEDGRMTDGRGETVYFGESLIVFTSNAGITNPPAFPGDRPMPNVDPKVDTEYEDVRRKVTEGVHRYFKESLGRPELLNRIGRNVVVFDFVRPEVMRMILERKVLPKIQEQVKERWRIEVNFAPEVADRIVMWVSEDIGSGGRGVQNLAEVALLNPLSRIMFELWQKGELEGARIEVKDVMETPERYELKWEACA